MYQRHDDVRYYLFMSSPKHMEMLFVINTHFVSVIHFYTLPTSIIVDVLSHNKVKISTDGEFEMRETFLENELPTFLTKNKQFHYIPDGLRYGLYKKESNINHKLVYAKEFWHCPRIPYKEGHEPFMSDIRVKPTKDYFITFSKISQK